MSEVTFRAIVDNDLSEWTYGYYVLEGNSESYIHNSNGLLRVKPETLGQYTGLKDKHGTDIYEGDIIKVKSCSYIVTWVKLYAAFKFVPINKSIGNTGISGSYRGLIVGNLHCGKLLK